LKTLALPVATHFCLSRRKDRRVRIEATPRASTAISTGPLRPEQRSVVEKAHHFRAGPISPHANTRDRPPEGSWPRHRVLHDDSANMFRRTAGSTSNAHQAIVKEVAHNVTDQLGPPIRRDFDFGRCTCSLQGEAQGQMAHHWPGEIEIDDDLSGARFGDLSTSRSDIFASLPFVSCTLAPRRVAIGSLNRGDRPSRAATMYSNSESPRSKQKHFRASLLRSFL